MTVKEVFDLRKQGRIEEAYEAIRPMYAAHKGRYTTLCMFWTAADVFKLRLDQGRTDVAAKILEALKRILPNVEAVNKELDTQAAAKATSTPAATSDKLPWEHDKTKQEGSSASAFIATATRRLNKARKDNKKAPLGATDHSRGCQPTVPDTTHNSEPRRGDTTSENPSHPDNPCPNEEKATNSQLLNDYPGHLIVSLDEGIIRPVADLNAPQRVVLACITAHPGYSVPQISASTGIPAKSIERHVAALIDKNLIEHRGSKKTGGYYAI